LQILGIRLIATVGLGPLFRPLGPTVNLLTPFEFCKKFAKSGEDIGLA